MQPTLARVIKTKTFSAASAAALDTAITTWRDASADQKLVIEVSYQVDGGTHCAIFFYTEG